MAPPFAKSRNSAGENPHQKAALYQESGTRAWGVVGAKVLQGPAGVFQQLHGLRFGLAVGVLLRGPRGRGHQAQQPLRGGRGRESGRRLSIGLRGGFLSAFGGGSWGSTGRSTGDSPGAFKLFFGMCDRPWFPPRGEGTFSGKSNPGCWNSRRLADPTMGTSAGFRAGFGSRPQDAPRPLEMVAFPGGPLARGANVPGLCAWQVAKQVKVERHCAGAGPCHPRASAPGRCPASTL